MIPFCCGKLSLLLRTQLTHICSDHGGLVLWHWDRILVHAARVFVNLLLALAQFRLQLWVLILLPARESKGRNETLWGNVHLWDTQFRPKSWATGSNSHKCFFPVSRDDFKPFTAKPLCHAHNSYLKQLVPCFHFFIPNFIISSGHQTRKQWVELSATKDMSKDMDCSAVTPQLVIHTNQHKWLWSQSGLELVLVSFSAQECHHLMGEVSMHMHVPAYLNQNALTDRLVFHFLLPKDRGTDKWVLHWTAGISEKAKALIT